MIVENAHTKRRQLIIVILICAQDVAISSIRKVTTVVVNLKHVD